MSPLWKNIFSFATADNTLVGFLASSPLFAELTTREQLLLTEYMHARHYDAGEAIYAEGDIGSGFYLIRTGLVVLSLEGPDGEHIELARLQSGDFFGETALTEPSPRLNRAVAQETCELVGMFRSDMQQLAKNRPVLCNKVLTSLNRVLSRRIRTMESLHRETVLPALAEE